MAPTLETDVLCVCQNEELGKRTLAQIVNEYRGESKSKLAYKVIVKKNKAAFKPIGKKEAKLKKVDFKKIEEIYADEKANITAMKLQGKKDEKMVLALKFNDSNARKEFQALAKSSNPGIKCSNSNDSDESSEKSSSLTTDPNAVSEGNESSDPSEMEKQKKKDKKKKDKKKKRSDSLRSSLHETSPSPPPSNPSTYPRNYHEKSNDDESDVCSHCHQKLPRGFRSSEVIYEPKQRNSRGGNRQQDCTYYITYGGPTAKVYKPRVQGIKHLKTHHSNDYDVDDGTGRLEINYGNYRGNSSASTLSIGDHEKAIGTAICRTPVPRSQSVPRGRNPSKRRTEVERSKSQHPILYFNWNPEVDESYASLDPFQDDDNLSSNDDSSDTMSLRSRKIEELIQELGKPGAIRLY